MKKHPVAFFVLALVGVLIAVSVLEPGPVNAATWDEWLRNNDVVRVNRQVNTCNLSITSQSSSRVEVRCIPTTAGGGSGGTATPTATTGPLNPTPTPTSTPTPATPTPTSTVPGPTATATPTPTGGGNLVTITNGARYSNTNPAANTTYTCAPGIVLDGQNSVVRAFIGSANNVTIRDCIIQNYNSPDQGGAIWSQGSGWLIQDNEIRNNRGGGIDAGGTNTRVVHNNVHHNGVFGIAGGDGSNLLIENNDIHWNNTRKVDGSFEAGGGKVTVVNGVTWRNNRVSHNSGPGIWCDESCRNVVMEGNVVWNNGWAGLMHEISYNAIIRNNTVSNNGSCSVTGVTCDPRGAFWRVEVLIFNAGLQGTQSQITGNTISGPNVHIFFLNHDRESWRTWNWLITGNTYDTFDFECEGPSSSNCMQVRNSVLVED